jgi:hypothetical protein
VNFYCCTFSFLISQSAIPRTFSFEVLFTLLAILIVSGRVFYVLTRQWTSHRPIEALREWARDRDFQLQLAPDAELPEALAGLSSADPKVEMTLSEGSILLIRLTTAAKPTAPRPMWNLLICRSPAARRPAGLRPMANNGSFLDLFSLDGFPSLLPPERFVVFAAESKEAKAMAASPARGLLPADIGLLVHGPYLTLDFSTRPFDAIEFDRMLAIAEQVAKVQL